MTHHATDRAREFRQRQTRAESLLWSVLRAKQLCGLKFRRQHPVGPFFADFACESQSLIVEIDGGYHDHQYEGDVFRQQYLEDQGWSVLRFSNGDVLQDVRAVADAIARRLELEPQFKRRKGGVSGMLVARRPSPGPDGGSGRHQDRPLPKGEVAETASDDEKPSSHDTE